MYLKIAVAEQQNFFLQQNWNKYVECCNAAKK
jgi:hypothetical protein